MIDLDEIERKARAALGEHRWRVYRCHHAADREACAIKNEPFVSAQEDASQRGVAHDTNYDECQHHMALSHAEHIAAADPAAVLALVDRQRDLEWWLRYALEEWAPSGSDKADKARKLLGDPPR